MKPLKNSYYHVIARNDHKGHFSEVSNIIMHLVSQIWISK